MPAVVGGEGQEARLVERGGESLVSGGVLGETMGDLDGAPWSTPTPTHADVAISVPSADETNEDC